MKDLTSGNIHKTFFLFTIPMILSAVLSQAFGIVDTSIAGIFLGSKGLAALGATVSALTVVESLMYGFNAGVSMYLANCFGARDYKKFKMLYMTNVIFIFAVTTLIAALMIVFNVPILSFLNIEDVIYVDSRNYYFLLCINMPFVVISHYFIYVMSTVGNTTFSLYVSIIAALINVVGNILSVTVFDLGVIGLGMATVISTVFTSIIYYIRINRHLKEMGVDGEKFVFSWGHVRTPLPSALPNSAQQLSMYLAAFIISPVKNGLGYIALASLAIITRIQGVIYVIYGNCARAVSIFIPQCVGAHKYDRIKKAIRVSFIQSFAIFVPIIVAVWLFPNAVCSLFVNDETEPQVIQNVVDYVKIFLPFVSINAISSIFHSIFRGIKSNRHLFISTTVCSIVGVITAYILCPAMGIAGYHLQSIIAWSVECVYIAVVYFSGMWIPKELRPMIHKNGKAKKT